MRFAERKAVRELDGAFFYSAAAVLQPLSHRRQEYRGANAGDFSGSTNRPVVGLCRANDLYYAQLLWTRCFACCAGPGRLRECMSYRSLLDELLAWRPISARAVSPEDARSFLEVCDLIRAHATPTSHMLVSALSRSPQEPRRDGSAGDYGGPPLPVLLRSLETLRDCASPRSAATSSRGTMTSEVRSLVKSAAN